jgi:predicted DNA-binding transcriptional regulator AlpA
MRPAQNERPRLPTEAVPENARLLHSHSSLAAQLAPLLSLDDVAVVLSCSRRLVERMRAAGRLPRPDLMLGKKCPRWRVETISEWIRGGGR